MRESWIRITIALSVLAAMATACGKGREPEAPRISIEGERVVYIDAQRGSFEIEVNSNRDWTVEIPENAGWMAAVPSRGSGRRKVLFDFGPNEGLGEQVTVKIATQTVSVDLCVVREGSVAGTTLLYESMGSPAVGGNTAVADFTAPKYAWTLDGAGTQGAYYTMTQNMSVRTTMNSAGRYEGASGGNCLFFGSGTNSLTINDIYVEGYTQGMLSFGCSKAEGGDYVAFSPSDLSVIMSVDGGQEKQLTYSRAQNSGWGLASAYLPLAAGASRITLRFTAGVSSAVRIDDIKVIGAGDVSYAVPLVTTGVAANVTAATATIGGNTFQYAPGGLTGAGVRYRIEGSAGNYAEKSAAAIASPFNVELSGLQADTRYEYQAYVRVGTEIYVDASRQPVFTTAKSAKEVVFQAPALSQSVFRVGVETAGATISIPYSNAAGGESYDVTLAASGPGAAGMPAVEPVKAVLRAGTGNIVVAIPRWTPSAEGALVLTVGGIGTLAVKSVPADVLAAIELPGAGFSASWNFAGYPTDKTAAAAGKWAEIIRPTVATTAPAIAEVQVGSLTPVGFSAGSSAPATGGWGGVDFSRNTAANYLADPQGYACFTVTATKPFAITGLSGNFRRSSTGPATASVQYSLDGTTFYSFGSVDMGKSDGQPYNPFSIAGGAIPAALAAIPAGATVTIRIVPYGGTNGTKGVWYINSACVADRNPDFTLTGRLK